MQSLRGHLLVCAVIALSACVRAPSSSIDIEVSAAADRAVVYGEDGRVDAYDVSPNTPAFAAIPSVAAFIDFSSIAVSPNGEDVTIVASALGPSYGLCDDERFVDQPTASWCSGILIDDDLVLTAAHCVDAVPCGDFAVVFDYLYRTPGESFDIGLFDDVFVCTEIVVYAFDDALDYAILRLDRPATLNRAPIAVATTLAPVDEGAPLVLMGTPSGLPVKTDDGGRVVDPRVFALDFFTATVDAFGGNSGSGVLDETGTVVGVLVRGEEDYVFTDEGCARVNTLDDDGSEGAEQIVYAARAVVDLCASGVDSALCESEPGVCASCGPGAPCPDDFTCLSWQENPGLTFCAPSCALGCPFGHSCSVAGVCLPDRAPTCLDGDVWEEDACGQAIVKLEECGALSCVGAQCTDVVPGDTCDTAIAIEAVNQVLTGTLVGATNSGGGSCGVSGPDVLYTFVLDEPARLVANAAGFDTLLHVRQECDDQDTEVACDDDGGPGANARLDVLLAPGAYTLFMDAWSDVVGDYSLSLEFDDGCGNACTIGETVCAGQGGVRTCVVGPSGCPVLSPPEPCPFGTVCAAGACVADCPPSCLEGDARCASDVVVETCEQVGDCLVYVPTTCPPGTACSDDACVDLCPDDVCTPGERVCGDDARVLECQVNDGGCPALVELGTCPLGMSCAEGVCEGECTDACTIGEQRCASPTSSEACIANLGGCGAWSAASSCPSGRACVDGACDASCSACTPGESRCATAHAAVTCVVVTPECTAWSAPTYCFGVDVCQDGVCAPDDDTSLSDAGLAGPTLDPAPPRVTVAPVSGCTSVDGGDGFSLVALLALLGLARRRVRRGSRAR